MLQDATPFTCERCESFNGFIVQPNALQDMQNMTDAQSAAVAMLRMSNILPSTWIPDNSTVLILHCLNSEIQLALANHGTI